MGQIGQTGHKGVEALQQLSQRGFVGLELIANARNFRQDGRCVFALAFELPDLLGQGIAPGLELLGTGLAGLALILQGLEGRHVEAHSPGGKPLCNKVQTGTQQLHIKHDNPYSNQKISLSIQWRSGICLSTTTTFRLYCAATCAPRIAHQKQ